VHHVSCDGNIWKKEQVEMRKVGGAAKNGAKIEKVTRLARKPERANIWSPKNNTHQ
jgi:hypothetical protein